MKKIVLLMPNTHEIINLNVKKDPPIGILYIAAVLRKAGYEVHIIDAFAMNLDIDDTVAKIMLIQPDYVGISCNYSPLHNVTLRIANEIKRKSENINIFVGGNHATASSGKLLLQSKGNIDVICLGQGEKSVLSYITSMDKGTDFTGIPGISYIFDGVEHRNELFEIIENLDELPFPAYDLVDMRMYERYNIIASRGCPYSCTYCASNVIVNRKVRYRSATDIVDEIEMLIKNYGEKMVWFSDDTFTANLKFANSLMDEIEKRKIKFVWSCLTRVNNTSISLIKKMKKNGCRYISYGIESGNNYILSSMNKMITKEEIINTIQLTKEAEIEVYTFFLIGYPGETLKTVEDSFDLIAEAKPDGASFAIVIPLPGTEMWRQLENSNIICFDEIKWDYLFAKTGSYTEYERYSASLASRWCEISEQNLIDLYNRGNNINTI